MGNRSEHPSAQGILTHKNRPQLDKNFSLFEVLLFIGIVQGFIVSLAIWFRKKQEPDKLLLSCMLTVFNLLCIKIMLFTTGLWNTAFFRYFPLPFDLAIQPLVYLYITSLITPAFILQRKHLFHFIPFLVSLVYSVFVYAAVFSGADPAAKDNIANSYLFNPVKETEDLLSVCSAAIYWAIGMASIIRYRKWLFNTTSNTLFPTYNWLKNVICLFGVFFVLFALNVLLDYGWGFGRDHFIHWQLFFVFLAIIIYYLGIRGYQQKAHQLPIVPDRKPAAEEPVNIISEKEADTINSQPAAIQYKEAAGKILKAFSEDKIYLDPELNLQALAGKVHVSSAVVSAVISSEFKKNFRNLVNEYRVQAVKARLHDPRSGQLSLLGIAYECGFNSEASFYRIFKNIAGLSPKEYLRQQQQS